MVEAEVEAVADVFRSRSDTMFFLYGVVCINV
jgi:hypothetical protein